jgi:FixJ family two-component response regulator
MKPEQVVHVVDDDEDFQTAVSRLLRTAGYVVRNYLTAGDFLLRQPADERGCLLLDIQMPGPSGVDLQEALIRQGNPMPVIFITGHADVPSTVRAMKMGPTDFLTKPVRREILLKAIERALAIEMENQIERSQLSLWHSLYLTLTIRELDIFERVVAGCMNKEIAVDLQVSERTVKAYRANVMHKMCVSSVAQLVQIAEKLRAQQAFASTRTTVQHGQFPSQASAVLR